MAPMSAKNIMTRSMAAHTRMRYAIIAILLTSATLSISGCGGHKQLDPQQQSKADQMRQMHSQGK